MSTPDPPTAQPRSAPCLTGATETRSPPPQASLPNTRSNSLPVAAEAEERTIRTISEDFQCPICMDTFINVSSESNFRSKPLYLLSLPSVKNLLIVQSVRMSVTKARYVDC